MVILDADIAERPALQTSMYFLARSTLYEHEKPYSLRFEPEAGFPRSNITMVKHEDIMIQDIRGREKDFSYEKNGFAILNLNTSLAYEDFEDKQKVIDVYLKDVADLLRDFLHAERVQIFEHTVRA